MFVLNIIDPLDNDPVTWETDEHEWATEAVNAYLHFLYSECDGWEWMKHSDVNIRCVNTATNEDKIFKWKLEYEPTFAIYSVDP